MLSLALVLCFVGAAGNLSTDDVYLPLFVIERSTNANVVHYEVRVTQSGAINPTEPVVVYWVIAAKGRREGLNSLEKHRGYGFKISPDSSPDVYRMALAAQPKRPLRVFVENGSAHAEALIDGHRAYLQKIYISTGKINILHINYIELYGVDVVTGEQCKETITH